MSTNVVRIVRSDDFLPYLSPLAPYVGFGDEVIVEKSSNLWNIGVGVITSFSVEDFQAYPK